MRDVTSGERSSVLRGVSVERGGSAPPGRQLERQLATMVREGRLEPGSRLPSTRRLAAAVGLHRNTVAAAYRRLAARELLETRHGARARVSPAVDGRSDGPAEEVLVSAADAGTTRLAAAELRAGVSPGVDVKPAEVDRSGGGASGGRRLVAGLPGPALRLFAGASTLRLRQDRRDAARAALRRAPPLAVVVVATECPALREAVLGDAARLRRRDLSLHPVDSLRGHRWPGGGGSVPVADLAIADRLAADAFCEGNSSSSGPVVVRARLLCRDSVAEVARRLGGPGD